MSYSTIANIFKLSETFTPTLEPCIPLRRLRKYIDQYRIKESDFIEYLQQLNRYNKSHPYIETLVQKLYHPTDEDLKTDERLLMNVIRIV